MTRRTFRQATLRAAERSLLAVALVGLVACGSPDQEDTRPVGRAALALNLPDVSDIDYIDYTLVFTFLESNPPVTYLTREVSSHGFGGELLEVVPCQTERDGTGLNRVDVHAVVHFNNSNDPYEVDRTSVFECVRNADTRVNIVLNIVGALDAGFADIDLAASGTLCSGKTDMLGDGYLGVCPDSTCGDSDAIMFFANNCETVSNKDPIFWVCGTPTDWVIQNTSAGAYFPVPDIDGEWDFGLVALDPLRMAQADPTLTDVDGNLQVWTGVAFTRTVFTRIAGVSEKQKPETVILDFAALLEVAPQAVGQPSPQVLLLGLNTDEGVYINFQSRFGPCEVDVEGVNLYSDYHVLDVRRDGPNKARLLLEDMNYEFVMMVATCETSWSAEGRPVVTCGDPQSVTATEDNQP